MTADHRSTVRSLFSKILSARHDPAARILNVDLVAILVAAMLPWTTSGVSIGVVVWLVALVPTVDRRELLHTLRRPVCWLPIALVALAAVGTLWSEAPWGARTYALSPATKLLVLPLLLYHFQRSPRGICVFIAFLVSCMLMTAMSWLVMLHPGLALKHDDVERGIFVKNYIDQSQEFALCAVALAYPAAVLLRENRRWQALLLIAVAASFLLNMAFVIVSRTAIVTIPVMLAVFALLHLKRRTSLMIFGALVVLAGFAWTASPQLRWTAETFVRDYKLYKERNVPTSIGLRLEFWQKSLRFFAEAPVIGHGTGSTRQLFEMAAAGTKDLASGQVIGNPHNQTLNVAIQWGAVGVVILFATWLCHLLLFRGEGLMAWIGLLVVVQNIFTSLFNSHLFDFHEGWMYVLGVGVAGGAVLRVKASDSAGKMAGGAAQEPAREPPFSGRL
jgi:O-antigen ligase